MLPIGQWVLREAARCAARWHARRPGRACRSRSTCRRCSSSRRLRRRLVEQVLRDEGVAGRAARARADRAHADGRPARRCARSLTRLQALGMPHLDRRLRHRLLVARPPEGPADRQAEDRPLVRRATCPTTPRAAAIATRDRADGARPRLRGDRRRRRDRGAARLPGRHRLRRAAGRLASRCRCRRPRSPTGCARSQPERCDRRRRQPLLGVLTGRFQPASAACLRARHRQLAGRRVLADRRAAADRRAVADRHRRDQHAVAADVHVVADHGAVLVGAVVVGGDAAGAVVDALADRRVAEVGQVVGLGAACRACEFFTSTKLPMCTSSPSSAPGRSRANGPISAPAPIAARRRCGVNGWITAPAAIVRVADHAVRADAHAVAELARGLRRRS